MNKNYLGMALTGGGTCSRNSIHRSSTGTGLWVKTSFQSETATSTGKDRWPHSASRANLKAYRYTSWKTSASSTSFTELSSAVFKLHAESTERRRQPWERKKCSHSDFVFLWQLFFFVLPLWILACSTGPSELLCTSMRRVGCGSHQQRVPNQHRAEVCHRLI